MSDIATLEQQVNLHRKVLFGNGEGVGVVESIRDLMSEMKRLVESESKVDKMLRGDDTPGGKPGLYADVRSLTKWVKYLTFIIGSVAAAVFTLLVPFIWGIVTHQILVSFP